MAMLKRFLQHQISVRALLYAQLYALQKEFPMFRLLTIRLMLNHLQSLLTEEVIPLPLLPTIYNLLS